MASSAAIGRFLPEGALPPGWGAGVAGRCRSRHLYAGDVAFVAAAAGAPIDIDAAEAVAAQAIAVYKLAGKAGALDCRGRRLREAAQLLYEAASLRLAGRLSGVVAGLLALVYLALNGEPLPPREALVEAVRGACTGSLGPGEVADVLGRGVGGAAVRAPSVEAALAGLQGYLDPGLLAGLLEACGVGGGGKAGAEAGAQEALRRGG